MNGPFGALLYLRAKTVFRERLLVSKDREYPPDTSNVIANPGIDSLRRESSDETLAFASCAVDAPSGIQRGNRPGANPALHIHFRETEAAQTFRVDS